MSAGADSPEVLSGSVGDPQSDGPADATEQDSGVGQQLATPQRGDEAADRRADQHGEPITRSHASCFPRGTEGRKLSGLFFERGIDAARWIDDLHVPAAVLDELPG